MSRSGRDKKGVSGSMFNNPTGKYFNRVKDCRGIVLVRRVRKGFSGLGSGLEDSSRKPVTG